MKQTCLTSRFCLLWKPCWSPLLLFSRLTVNWQHFPQRSYPLRIRMTCFWSGERGEPFKVYIWLTWCFTGNIFHQLKRWNEIQNDLSYFYPSWTTLISSPTKHISTLRGECKLLWQCQNNNNKKYRLEISLVKIKGSAIYSNAWHVVHITLLVPGRLYL